MNLYSKRIATIAILLIIFGIFAMYSVSIYESFSVTKWITNYFYFKEHLNKLLIGSILWIITRFIPWRTIKKLDIFIFLWSFILVLLLFSSLGENAINDSKNARLWLFLPWQTIQPWEFFKLGYVFFLSNWLMRKKENFSEIWLFFWTILVVCLLCLIFMFLPDFGSILVLWIVWMILYRYIGGKIYYIIVASILGLAGIMLIESKIDYIHQRIQYYLDPTQDKSNSWIWYQINNALTAVWWWGFWGRWYWKGLQKFWNLPESQSDFIFSAFLEEIWLLWGSILLTLYFLLAYYSIKWISLLKNQHDATLWFGILSLIIVQACINMWVNINLIPLTWLTLPFISHGWSALIINMIEVTLLMKIVNQKP